MADISRRNWLAALAVAGGGLVESQMAGNANAMTAQARDREHQAHPLARSALEFGARGDAKKDNTAAFQKALDAVYAAGGGIVSVPAGRYLFKGHLTMPANTSLEGVFLAPPAYIHAKPASGTVLLVTEGRGQSDGVPFIGANGNNCTIRGLGIYYPDQDPHAASPAPYPWAIGPATAAPVEDLSVIDVALTNPYQGINLVGAPRHYIARVYGHPIKTGLIVDRCYDIGRIENCHFWPFWAAAGTPACNWIQAHGTAFVFGRSDWQYVFNTFSWGYHIGYQFIATPQGACNGNFLGIGADSTFEALRVEAAQPASGLLITNGEFVGMIGTESQGFAIGPKNVGQVVLNNCGFWGPSNRIGTIQGNGPVSLIGCNFQQWDKNGHGEPAILCDGAPTTVMGCQFLHADRKKLVGITKQCAGAIITGNTSMGSAFTLQRPGRLPRTRFQIHSNIAAGV